MMSADSLADTIARFVGARVIAGSTLPEIVAELDENLTKLRREFAIASTSVNTSPVYSLTKAVADNLRARC